MCVKYVKDISRDFVPNIFNLLKPAFFSKAFYSVNIQFHHFNDFNSYNTTAN